MNLKLSAHTVSALKENKNKLVFLLAAYVLLVLFVVNFTSSPLGAQMQVFFGNTSNLFADFFSVARYASASNPYTQPNVSPVELAYFPLAYWIMRPLAGLCTAPGNVRLAISAVMMSFFSMILCCQLASLCPSKKALRPALIVILFFSGIFLFSFERGNLIFISAICVLFFLQHYQSDRRLLRELAFIALGVSVALKGFPGIFVLLLVYEKKWWQAARVCLYSAVLLLVPFLFFEGGFANIPVMLNNLKISTDSYRIRQFKRYGLGYLFQDRRVDTLLGYEKMTKVFAAVSAVMGVFLKDKWKKVALIACLLVMVPVNSAMYSGLYLLPPLVMFFYDADRISMKNPLFWVYTVLFMAVLTPYQFPQWTGGGGGGIHNLAVLLLWMVLLAECIAQGMMALFAKRSSLPQISGRHGHVD